MAENAKPKINAEAAYENAQGVVQDLVTRIGELLFDLSTNASLAVASAPCPSLLVCRLTG
jgi:hypothetical protein